MCMQSRFFFSLLGALVGIKKNSRALECGSIAKQMRPTTACLFPSFIEVHTFHYDSLDTKVDRGSICRFGAKVDALLLGSLFFAVILEVALVTIGANEVKQLTLLFIYTAHGFG